MKCFFRRNKGVNKELLKILNLDEELAEDCITAFYAWLNASGLTVDEFSEFASCENFRIETTEQGYAMVCEKDGEVVQIGTGVYKDQAIEACLIFTWATVGLLLSPHNAKRYNFPAKVDEWMSTLTAR